MPQFTGALVQHPARVSFVWYGGLIAFGTLLLTLPWCGVEGRPAISMLDACFTTTSAVCVTGLAVRMPGSDFSFFGQFVIVMLCQLGGIGIMTVTTFVTFNIGVNANLRHRAIISETLGASPAQDLNWVLRRVLEVAFYAEAIGAAILALWFHFVYKYSVGKACWYGVFHSVMAFCNAGFGLEDDSLESYKADWVINLVVMTLVVVGGIGFPVLLDIGRKWRGSPRDCWDHLLLHSKLMLLGTAALVAIGTALFLILEAEGVLAGMPWHQKFLVSLFQSVTPRTAGFNTVAYRDLSNATLFVTMMLMMIGAGPCSTGGGFKVSTLMVLATRALCTIRGLPRVQVFRRTIPPLSVEKAVATSLMFSVVAICGLSLILVFEQSAWMRQSRINMLAASTASSSGAAITASPGEAQAAAAREGLRQREASLFLDASFEVLSALGTVGLSTGLTTQLTDVGRLVVILLMFIGRLGPFTVLLAFARGERNQRIEYAPEEPLIG